MTKNFILDTNVLIDDPDAIFKMDDNNVIITDVTLKELDRFKKEESERGFNACAATKNLDEASRNGNLTDGISLGEGKGMLKMMFTLRDKAKSFPTDIFPLDLDENDNRLIYLAYRNPGFIIVTKDRNLRLRANSVMVKSETYKNDQVYENPNSKKYTGRTSVYLLPGVLNQFKKDGYLNIETVKGVGYTANGEPFDEELFINEFFEMYPIRDNSDGRESALLGRFDGKRIVPLRYADAPMSGVHPRNIGQYFMQECLLQPSSVAPLVVIKGVAGTAKTFFAMAAGLEKYRNSTDREFYHRIMVCRPYVLMDKDPGALPGTELDKVSPLIRPVKDNLAEIIRSGSDSKSEHEFQQTEEEVENLFESGIVKAEAFAFLRGRTLKHYWFVLDEMQNSSPMQAKTAITRSGIGSKFILLGDPEQIDNPRNTPQSNGLVYASEKMKGSPLCWQVQLTQEEGERSALAMEAAIRMKGRK